MDNNKFYHPQRSPPPEKNIPRVKRWGEVGFTESRQKIKIVPPCHNSKRSHPLCIVHHRIRRRKTAERFAALSSYRAKKDYSATGLYLRSNIKRTEPSKRDEEKCISSKRFAILWRFLFEYGAIRDRSRDSKRDRLKPSQLIIVQYISGLDWKFSGQVEGQGKGQATRK